MSDLWTLLSVTLAAGAATGVGALPVFFGTRVSHRVYDAAIGLAAGVMLSAAAFSLVVPGMEAGNVGEVVDAVLVV